MKSRGCAFQVEGTAGVKDFRMNPGPSGVWEASGVAARKQGGERHKRDLGRGAGAEPHRATPGLQI